MRSKLVGVLALVLVVVSGCARQTGGVAASSMPIAPGSYEELGPVRGSDCAWYLLGLLPLSGGNETSAALRDALGQKSGTDALIEVTADSYGIYWILFSNACTEVEGTAVRLR